MPKGPKGKKPGIKFGKQNMVDDELDAYDYAEEDASYQRWEETQVKENKLLPQAEIKVKVKVKEELKVKVKEELKVKEEKPLEDEERRFNKEELEEELEQFDDWEAAMDALDAKITKDEEKKARMANSKPK